MKINLSEPQIICYNNVRLELLKVRGHVNTILILLKYFSRLNLFVAVVTVTLNQGRSQGHFYSKVILLIIHKENVNLFSYKEDEKRLTIR